jgi:HK97 family phage major capsid protein
METLELSPRLKALKEKAEAKSKSAREVAEKALAEDRDMTDDEKDVYVKSMAELKETLEAVQTVKADEQVLADAKAFGDSIGIPKDGGALQPVRKSLGELFTQSPEFKNLLKSFPDGRIPSGTKVQSAPVQMKSLFTGLSSTSGGAFVVNDRTDIVEMLGRKDLRLRDLVSNRRTTSDAVEFVQETSHTNAAAVVAEATSSAAPTLPALDGNALSAGAALVNNAGGGYKPEGSWAFQIVTTNVKTIAEWVPVTKRALADVAQLEGLINDELRADVAETEEDQILNGNGSGENFTGIANTSGIQTQAFSTNIFTSIRKGITKARTVGRVMPNGILMNPADAEAVDLATDGNTQYYYGGPQRLGPRTMWGLPIVESESQTSGFATVGDFKKAVIWDREQTTVTATDSHADFFVRNLVAILAEERLAFGVVRPSAFVTVDIVA